MSDLILNKIENARGARFPNRSLIFLIIIMVLALGSFTLIDHLTDKPTSPTPTTVENSADQKPAEAGTK
ncbi:MAG: hypothetical protein GY753_03380 [Gammaproteobacteria bacterium]|nr:hypothetical protein [Gammaproteobacteria bacterium]